MIYFVPSVNDSVELIREELDREESFYISPRCIHGIKYSAHWTNTYTKQGTPRFVVFDDLYAIGEFASWDKSDPGYNNNYLNNGNKYPVLFDENDFRFLE